MAIHVAGNALSVVSSGVPAGICHAQCARIQHGLTIAPVSHLLGSPRSLLPTHSPLPLFLPLQIAKECRAAGKAVFVESLVSLRLLL